MFIPRGHKRHHQPMVLLVCLLALSLAAGATPAAEADTDLRPEVGHLAAPPGTPPETVRLVTFNVHYAEDLPRLIAWIGANPALSAADVFLLQEIESYPAEGASRADKLARALRLNYVYAPARRTDEGGTHGLAILSRFPLADVKVLPLKQYHLGYNTRRRIALAATLKVAGRLLRIYNVHLDTRINIEDRLEQLRPVVEAARRHPVAEIVIGGDFNTNPFRWAFHVVPFFHSDQAGTLDEFMKDNGFAAPFAEAGSTSRKPLLKIRVDSLYARGLWVKEFGIERSVDVSDHLPLWMDIGWGPPKVE